jgi:hypothetical protein
VTGWRLTLDFSLEAEIIGGGILANVSRHVRPPVVSGNQFERLPPSGMSGDMAVISV